MRNETPRELHWRDYVEDAAKILPVVVLLLPVVGVAVRELSFLIGGVPVGSPFRLAWSAPLNQLVGTGINSLGPFLLMLLPLPAAVVGIRKIRAAAPGYTSSQRVSTIVQFVALLALILAVAIFAPDWQLSLLLCCSTVLSLVVVLNRVRRYGRVTLTQAWPILAGLVLFSALNGGMRPVLIGVEPASYVFKPALTAAISDGRYAELGREDGMLYLAKCDSRDHEVIGVHEDDVSVLRLERRGPVPSNPSVWEVLVSHRFGTLGLASPC